MSEQQGSATVPPAAQVTGQCTLCLSNGKLLEVYERREHTRIPKPWRWICEECIKVGLDAKVLTTVRVQKAGTRGKSAEWVDVLALMGGDKQAAYFYQLRTPKK